MIYQSFYIKAPVTLLDVELPLTEFLKDDGSYHSITTYLAEIGHTVERFSNDGVNFIKGFGFTVAGLDEMRAKFIDFGLELGVNVWILSPNEVQTELATAEWISSETR